MGNNNFGIIGFAAYVYIQLQAHQLVKYFSLPIDPNENKLLLCWLQRPLLCVRAPTWVKLCCVLEQGTFTPQKYWYPTENDQ